MLFVVLCPGTHEGSTGSGSGFKASQKTGQRLKVSSDRLGEAVNRTCDPWFTRHRFIPYTTVASLNMFYSTLSYLGACLSFIMTFSLAIQLLIGNDGIVECTKHEHMYTMASSKGNNLNRMQYLLYPLSKKKRIEIEQMPDTDQYTATFKET